MNLNEWFIGCHNLHPILCSGLQRSSWGDCCASCSSSWSNIPRTHKEQRHIGWRPSMPLPNAPSLPPKQSSSIDWTKNKMNHAATCWSHYETCHFQCQSSNWKFTTATKVGAVCSNSERRLILQLNLHKFPDHEMTINQCLDWKWLRRI